MKYKKASLLPLSLQMYTPTCVGKTRGGISAKQVQHEKDVSSKTTWRLFNLFRRLLDEDISPFGCDVEVDDSYFGGKRKGKRVRGAKDKNPVLGIVKRKGKIKAVAVPNLKSNTEKPHIENQIDKNANVYSDEFRSYRGLYKEYAKHSTVRHGTGQYVNGNAHTNTLEGWFSLLKRGVNGTLHHVSEKHFDKYVNEFVFRYNNHKVDDSMR